MRKNLVILCFMVVWAVLTATALLWGFRYDWPDNVHVDYGLPLTWATNTLSSIAGPVDLWEVNVSNLMVDLMLWLAIVVAAVALMLYKLKDRLLNKAPIVKLPNIEAGQARVVTVRL